MQSSAYFAAQPKAHISPSGANPNGKCNPHNRTHSQEVHMSKAQLIKGLACLSLALGLSACSYQRHFESSPSDYGSRTDMNEATGFRTYNTQLKAADHHNHTMTFSQSSSDVIDDMKGIRTSFVIVTDKNAYVAILLD